MRFHGSHHAIRMVDADDCLAILKPLPLGQHLIAHGFPQLPWVKTRVGEGRDKGFNIGTLLGGEVSRITEVKPYVLRYWESEFRWMAPQKSRSKQRLYRRRDIDMILLIKKLRLAERNAHS